MKHYLRTAAVKFLTAVGKSDVGGRINQLLADSMMRNIRHIDHHGLRMSFVAPNHLNSWRIGSFSSKEPETLEWIETFSEGSVLWDIGANIGLYSCYAAKRRRCKVFAFEPSVFNLELLARNVWVNDLCEQVTLVPLPLTDRLANSTLNMTSTEWGGAMSTFDESYTHDGSTLRKIFEFRTVGLSMDDAASQLKIPLPDYIKMDVDGIEHLILKGGAAVLRSVKGLLIEINEEFQKQTQDSARYLSDAGLVLQAKRHSEMFDKTAFRNCYNQIWHRPTP
jgi:FkbM family methyltransferase